MQLQYRGIAYSIENSHKSAQSIQVQSQQKLQYRGVILKPIPTSDRPAKRSLIAETLQYRGTCYTAWVAMQETVKQVMPSLTQNRAIAERETQPTLCSPRS